MSAKHIIEALQASSKRKIHQNIWGNWNAYISGKKKEIDFGSDETGAYYWLRYGNEPSKEYERPDAHLRYRTATDDSRASRGQARRYEIAK